jgi:hypothetical protein
MLSAERIVLGNIGMIGNRYILSSRMLETETALTLNTADGIYASLDDMVDDLFDLAKRLAQVEGIEEAEPSTAEEPEAEEVPEDQQPPAELEPPSITPAAGNHWVLGTGIGTNIPLGNMAQALTIGIPALVEFGYVLEREWGALALGALSGFQYQSSRSTARYLYHMITAPLGVGVRYTTRGASPWHAAAGAAGGVTFNYVIYKESYPFKDNLLNISLFAAPSLGAGYRLSPKLSLELDLYLWMVFFSEMMYVGLAPVFGVELALGERETLAAPLVEEEGKATEVRDEKTDHWTLDIAAGTNIPLGSMSQALSFGFPALVSFSYTLEQDWGSLDLGALAGFQYQGTRKDARYLYHMLTAPIGVEVCYAIRWASPWYLEVGAAGGVTFNYVIYKESYRLRWEAATACPPG